MVLAEHKKLKVGLIGTKPTMEKDFFKQRLRGCGVESIVPDITDRNFIHQAVFNELTQGIFKADTRDKLIVIIEKVIVIICYLKFKRNCIYNQLI